MKSQHCQQASDLEFRSGLVAAGIRQRLLWAACSAHREPAGLAMVKDERHIVADRAVTP